MTGGASSAGSGGVDALRRAREGAASGGTGAVTDSGHSARGGSKPAGGGAAASTRFEAGEGAPKIDARDMAAGDARTGGTPAAPKPAPKDAAADEADGLARLRAARRRAQERNDGEGGGGA